jgi:hypothetical protein
MSFSSNSSLSDKMHQLFNANVFMFYDGQNISIGNRISGVNMKDGTITTRVFGTKGEKKLNVDTIQIIGTSQFKEYIYMSDK